MKNLPILHLGIVGFLVASVAGATAKKTESASEPVKDSGENQAVSEATVAETDEGETQESSSESEPEDTEGQIFGVHEREIISDPNFNVKKNKADEYFRRGTLLYEGGDYASAAQAFLVAYETLPHQAVLGNIALCFDKAGKIPEAVVYYREYLAKPVGSEKNDYMTARLKELETLVGELEIICRRINPCEIRVDGIARGQEHSEHAGVVLMPGEHRIEAYSNGILVQSKLVEIKTQQKLVETLDAKQNVLKKTLADESPPVIKLPEVHKNEPLWGPFFWLATGTTLASAAVAATFGGLVLRKKSQFENAEPNSPKQKELAKDGERLVLVTNIMVGVTGVGAIAAAVLGYRDVKKKNKKKVGSELTITTTVLDFGFGFVLSF